MRSTSASSAAPAGSAQLARPALSCGFVTSRCPQQQHVSSRAPHSNVRSVVSLAAAAETAEAVSADLTAAPESALSAPSTPGSSKKPRKPKAQKQQQSVDASKEEAPSDAIIVLDKPVTNSIVRRLAEVPQAVLRAGRPDDATTYKAVAAVASAQKQLSATNRVAVYVPYTKASRFTAQLVTADASITDIITTQPLTARANTDAAALGATLAFALLRDGGATVASAGAAATAKAAEALRVARALLLKKGFEIGSVPQFAESIGSNGQQITILRQDVVVKEMPPPEVVAPSNPQKPIDPAAAAAAALLARQRRCTLRVRQGQLPRLTELLFKAAQPRGRAAAAAAAAVGAAAVGAGVDGAAAEVSPRVTEERVKEARQALKPRLLLVSYTGTDAPTTPSSSAATATAAAPAAPATGADEAPAAEPAAAADSASPAAAGAASPAASAAAAAAAGAEVHGSAFVTLELLRSRFTFIPEARLGLAGPDGPLYAKKPVVATAESSVSGVAGALEGKLYKLGAAWLYTDGTVAGNRAAWEAFASVGRKLKGKAGRSSVLALVKVEQDTAGSASAEAGSSKGAAGAQEAAAASSGQEAAEAAAEQQQQQAQAEQGKQQQQRRPNKGAAPAGYRLSMLVVSDEDVSRSVMQAPNAPLESSKVGSKQALQLLKFAAAANCFLPVGEASGTGGLVLLPAVLPAPQGAMDYRFAGTGPGGSSSQQEAYDYYFRVQRYTDALPAGGIAGPDVQQLRVSPSTDPSRLRDAIVAKMLTGQPATLRFAAPPGQLPAFMLSVAMTAVAAARVRLQSKQAAVDVGVMPLVLSDRADGGGGAAAAAAAAGGKSKSEGAKGGSSGGDSRRVVYSLRLVPLPAAVADAAQVQLLE